MRFGTTKGGTMKGWLNCYGKMERTAREALAMRCAQKFVTLLQIAKLVRVLEDAPAVQRAELHRQIHALRRSI
jgi:hypothetical protein